MWRRTYERLHEQTFENEMRAKEAMDPRLVNLAALRRKDAGEYGVLVASLVAEPRPAGPTEKRLVKELAGVLWRKRRLRLAEAAAHRRELEKSFSSYRETAPHITNADKSADVSEAVHTAPADSQEELHDLDGYEAMTQRTLEIPALQELERPAGVHVDQSPSGLEGDRETAANPDR
jgi:hypothetical protein